MKHIRSYLALVLALFLMAASLLLTLAAARAHLGHINSDMLYSLSLYRDIFESRSASWWGWVLTPAPYFFPDLLGLFALFPMVKDPGWGYALYELIVILSTFVLLLPILKAVGAGSIEGLLLAALGIVATLLCLSPSMLEFWLFPTNHGGGMILGLALLGLLVNAKPSRLALIAVCLLMAFSDSLLIMQWLMPLWFVILLRDKFQALALPAALNKRMLKTSLGAAVAGLALQKLFALIGMFKYGDGKSLFFTNVPKSLRMFWQDLPELGVSMAALTCVILVWAAIGYKRRSTPARPIPIPTSEASSINLLIVVVVLCSLSSLFGPVLNGAYRGMSTTRYMLPFFILPLLLLPLLGLVCLKPLGSATARRRFLWSGLLASEVLGLGLVAAQRLRSESFKGGMWDLPYPAAVACVDAMLQGRDAYTAVSDYWPAKYIQELSKKKIIMRQVNKDLEDYYWITNPAWHLGQSPQNGFGSLDFVIANNLDEDKLLLRFGAPTKRAACEDLKVLFYPIEGQAAKL